MSKRYCILCGAQLAECHISGFRNCTDNYLKSGCGLVCPGEGISDPGDCVSAISSTSLCEIKHTISRARFHEHSRNMRAWLKSMLPYVAKTINAEAVAFVTVNNHGCSEIIEGLSCQSGQQVPFSTVGLPGYLQGCDKMGIATTVPLPQESNCTRKRIDKIQPENRSFLIMQIDSASYPQLYVPAWRGKDAMFSDCRGTFSDDDNKRFSILGQHLAMAMDTCECLQQFVLLEGLIRSRQKIFNVLKPTLSHLFKIASSIPPQFETSLCVFLASLDIAISRLRSS